ncbi:MAG: 6-carboxytetrahydropterin synthase [Pseudomonadota bacterium]
MTEPRRTADPQTDLGKQDTSITTIEIAKDYLHFSAAHFTLFSATERENLHGHNFQVAIDIEAEVDETGLCFDYNIVKDAVRAICGELDEQTLMPAHSPWLSVDREDGMVIVRFADERMPFLERDVLVLPVRNITVEELARWMLTRVRAEERIAALPVRRLVLRVASGPNQWARAEWQAAGVD